MDFTQTEISEILTQLQQGQKIEDLVELLNHVIKLQNEKDKTTYKPLTNKRVKFYYANINKRYVNFEIPKKTGGKRTITAPDKYLKKVQRRIDLILRLLFVPKPAAHGFLANRSIVSNAKIHVGKKYVLNIDLKDFFPSVHFGRIRAVLQLYPFRLKPEYAHVVANFCCFESKLPQGAPTSPIITNIVCQKLDYKLVQLAKEHHCYFTRYADDITFSCDKARFDDEFLKKLEEIVKAEGFVINEKKTRIQKRAFRQEVTGVTVNEKLNLQPDYIRNVRAMLHNWEKYGYEIANAKFAKFYPKEKGFLRNKIIPPLESVVSGKIMFLGMVRGKEDALYLRYSNQLKTLTDLKNTK